MIRTRLTAGLLLVCFSRPGCAADPEHVSADAFCALYESAMGTMQYPRYLGIMDGRAVIELHEMSTPGTGRWEMKTYWTEAGGVEGKCIAATR